MGAQIQGVSASLEAFFVPEPESWPIETDSAALGDLSRLLALGRLMPIGMERPFRRTRWPGSSTRRRSLRLRLE